MQYLDFRYGSDMLFLTQYSRQMQPNPVKNEQLTLAFQGVTEDGEYYVAGRFAITHPALPKGIDFPSLKSLKALLASLHVER